MYLTELEYLFGVCRSLIDLLHDCYRHIHRKNGGTELPDTFGKFVDKEVADLVKKYKLPPPTESYLNTVRPLFGMIRRVRDGIYHKGKSLERIFLTDHGPGICIEDPPFDPFKLVLSDDAGYERSVIPNRVGSLFYLVTKIADLMIEATNQLAGTLAAVFPKQPSYAKDGFRYFVRGPGYGLLTSRQQLMQACWLRQARAISAALLTNRPERESASGEQTRNDWVARNAYFRWVNAGRPHGHHDEHWWDAEREYICTVLYRQRRLDSFGAADVGGH